MSKIFDVAKWSTGDIKSLIIELDIKIDNIDDFVDSVINRLENNFDAEIGINWNVIENAIIDEKDNFFLDII